MREFKGTKKELLEQRNDLLEALQDTYNDLESWSMIHSGTQKVILAAITKALGE